MLALLLNEVIKPLIISLSFHVFGALMHAHWKVTRGNTLWRCVCMENKQQHVVKFVITVDVMDRTACRKAVVGLTSCIKDLRDDQRRNRSNLYSLFVDSVVNTEEVRKDITYTNPFIRGDKHGNNETSN